MDENAKFVNETDYKSLWKYSYDECERLKETNSALMDKIEDLERELSEVRLELTDTDGRRMMLEDRVSNLQGQVTAYQYAIRYHMAGDAQ